MAMLRTATVKEIGLPTQPTNPETEHHHQTPGVLMLVFSFFFFFFFVGGTYVTKHAYIVYAHKPHDNSWTWKLIKLKFGNNTGRRCLHVLIVRPKFDLARSYGDWHFETWAEHKVTFIYYGKKIFFCSFNLQKVVSPVQRLTVTRKIQLPVKCCRQQSFVSQEVWIYLCSELSLSALLSFAAPCFFNQRCEWYNK